MTQVYLLTGTPASCGRAAAHPAFSPSSYIPLLWNGVKLNWLSLGDRDEDTNEG
jgi:hypothetical protein